MVKYMDWCDWQHPCLDIHEGKPGTACMAHLNEDRIFECPYKNMEEAKKEPYPCVDATPKKE